MRFPKPFANALLLFTIPTLAAYPLADVPEVSRISSQIDSTGRIQFNNDLFSYDDVLDLIEEIEEGDIEERCTPEEIEGINRFMALLAKEGILPGDTCQMAELNRDIEELLSPGATSSEFYYSVNGGYTIEPAVFYGQAKGVHCKSWFKKQWDQTRAFVKKHKNEIIIGAAIVVAVAVAVTVVVLVASASTAATAAAGTAIGAASSISSSDSPESNSIPNESVSNEPPAPIQNEPAAPPIEEIIALKEVIDEKVSSFKNQMAVDSIMNPEKALDVDSASFVQGAREFGAALSHTVLEGASQLFSFAPQLLEDVRDIGERFIPKSVCDFQPSDIFNPLGNYEYAVDKGHSAIDEFFGVSQPQGEQIGSIDFPEFTYGALPPPGAVGPMVATEGRIAATQANSTRGWTIGQPIQNRTFWGGVPKWSTVRQRYWKNEAQLAKSNPNHPHVLQIPRMERGLAPQRFNRKFGRDESIELHHTPPQREGGLFDFIEVWPDEHAELDKLRRLGK